MSDQQNRHHRPSRAAKFCPPSRATLARGAEVLGGSSLRPILVLSDEPGTARAALLSGETTSSGRAVVALNESLFAGLDPVQRLVVEMDLAVHAVAFLGVACSTVSQLVVKRRQARAELARRQGRRHRPVPSDTFFLWP
mmetsp:Transcript_16177/g.65383  ORF Transcript_16177/g.65383 Transcript_16177/m.65383 type:complete len:139 (-) Transcript_16177:34-450(-)